MASKRELVQLLLLAGISMLTGSVESRGQEDARYKCVHPELVPAKSLKYTEDDIMHVGMIMTNVNRKQYLDTAESRMLRNLGRFLDSLLEASTGTPIHLIIISDAGSVAQVERKIANVLGQFISERLLYRFVSIGQLERERLARILPARFCVEFVDLESFTKPHREEIDRMKPHYCRLNQKDEVKKGPKGPEFYSFEKYCLDLFFIAPFYYDVFPERLKRIAVVDVDLSMEVDMSDLYHHFNFMNDQQMIAVATDQFTMYEGYYKHNMQKAYIKIRDSVKSGLNTGVVLYDLEKQRKSKEYKSEINAERFEDLAIKYFMKGTVGDQDWMSLLAWEHPDLFYLLPCELNSQVHPTFGTSCMVPPKIIHHHGSI